MSQLLTISKYALEQVTHAANWFDEEQDGLGGLFVEDLFEAIEFIKANPLACQIRYKAFRVKFLNRFSFGIHYKIEHEKIVVMAVFHTSQSDDNWFK
jgi:toxin ParE1/3/4